MPRSISISTPNTSADIQSAARTIRETIAHFFASDTPARIDTPVNEHTLRDIGVNSIRLLASKERHYVGVAGFGIEIAATDPIDG